MVICPVCKNDECEFCGWSRIDYVDTDKDEYIQQNTKKRDNRKFCLEDTENNICEDCFNELKKIENRKDFDKIQCCVWIVNNKKDCDIC